MIVKFKIPGTKALLWAFFILMALGLLFSYTALIFDGVYVVAKKGNIYTGGDSYDRWEYSFYYNGKQHNVTVTHEGSYFMRKDSLIFFQVSRHFPGIVNVQDNVLVPPCITFSNQPKEGWNEIPKCK